MSARRSQRGRSENSPVLAAEGTPENNSRSRSRSRIDSPPSSSSTTPSSRVQCEWSGCQHRAFRSRQAMEFHIKNFHLLNQDMRTSQQIAEDEAKASQQSTSEDAATEPAEVAVVSTPRRRSSRKRSVIIMEPPKPEEKKAEEGSPEVVEIRQVDVDAELEDEDEPEGPVYKTPMVILKGNQKEREEYIMNNPPPFIFTVKQMAEKLIPQLIQRQSLSKRKIKEEYCLPCLDFKLHGGRCSRQHDEHENDDRMQAFWLKEFPHDPKELTKHIVLADLQKIVAEWR